MNNQYIRKCVVFIFLSIGISMVAANVFAYSADNPTSCSIFTVSIGDIVFFGSNEDYSLTGTYMWTVPPQELDTPSGTIDIHGVVAFGYKYNDDPADGYAQGGMNDQGLCADGNALPLLNLNPHPERESTFTYPLDQILMECSNVDEVIEWFQSHNLGTQWSNQLHFADASGDAVVVSVGEDGEFVFSLKGSLRYIISTNFNLANTNVGQYPCQRYDTATSMLEAITSEQDLTVEAVRGILDTIHEEGEYGTKYSNIFDPVNKEIYVYQNHHFDRTVKLNLETVLNSVIQGAEGVIEENGLLYKETRIADLFTTTQPEEPNTQTSLISTEVAIVTAIALVCVIGIAAY